MPVSVPIRVAFQNILVTTDFSACSDAVLPLARSLALHYDATLFLTHVISPEVLEVDPSMIETAHRTAQKQMDKLEATHQLEGVKHKCLLEEGETWEMLKYIIDREHVDLVMVATHGRTGLKRLMLGSVAEDIFRHAPCPVLTIGPRITTEAARQIKIEHVLLATDLKPENEGPMMYAAGLAQAHKAHLTLLHVAETDSRIPLTKQLLDMVPKDVELTHPPEALIEIGDAAEKILTVAEQRHASLLVLGAHRPGFMTTHLMDVDYRVICEAPCPVLTVGAWYHQ